MKLRVTMKDTDSLYDAISEAIEKEFKEIELDDDEKEALAEIRREKVSEVASAWFKYDEYLTVEIDTKEETCKVLSIEELDK